MAQAQQSDMDKLYDMMAKLTEKIDASSTKSDENFRILQGKIDASYADLKATINASYKKLNASIDAKINSEVTDTDNASINTIVDTKNSEIVDNSDKNSATIDINNSDAIDTKNCATLDNISDAKISVNSQEENSNLIAKLDKRSDELKANLDINRSTLLNLNAKYISNHNELKIAMQRLNNNVLKQLEISLSEIKVNLNVNVNQYGNHMTIKNKNSKTIRKKYRKGDKRLEPYKMGKYRYNSVSQQNKDYKRSHSEDGRYDKNKKPKVSVQMEEQRESTSKDN